MTQKIGAAWMVDGKETPIAEMDAVTCFGESALVRDDGLDHVRSATVTAKTDVTLLSLSRDDFEELIDDEIISQSHSASLMVMRKNSVSRDGIRRASLASPTGSPSPMTPPPPARNQDAKDATADEV